MSTPAVLSNLRLWPLRVLWIAVPLTVGPLVEHALDDRVASFRVGANVLFWVVWAAALGALFVPRVRTLTFVRVVVPASLVAALWAVAASEVDAIAVVGVVVASASTVAVLLAHTGDEFVNGSSYGDERRMPVRPPAALLVGPVPLAWAACVAGALAGPLLLLAHLWIAGVLALAVGWPACAVTARALHQLARRWVVFVPAGFVLHDHLVLREPVLFSRTDIVALGPAPADTRAHDLTARAAGLALQVDFAVPVEVVPADGDPGEVTELVGITQFVFMPSRPGHLLAEAAARRIRVTHG